ncbi:MAG: hypothetical protein QF535_10095 [Anaerolineales bacterium]|nr:hypothetical protein [Anaerolineales bacterium]
MGIVDSKTINSLRRGEFGNRPLIAYEEANLAIVDDKTIISLQEANLATRPLIACEEANLAITHIPHPTELSRIIIIELQSKSFEIGIIIKILAKLLHN